MSESPKTSIVFGFEVEHLLKDMQVLQQFPCGHGMPTALPPVGQERATEKPQIPDTVSAFAIYAIFPLS